MTEQAAEAAIGAAATALRLPTVRREAQKLADDAARAGLTHRAYLAEVLSAGVCDEIVGNASLSRPGVVV